MHTDTLAMSARRGPGRKLSAKSRFPARSAVRLLLTALFVALLAGAGGAAEQTQAENMLSNGSFETVGEDGFPIDWRISRQPDDIQDPGMRGSVDTEIKHDGKQSLKIVAQGVKARYAGLMHTAVHLDGPATYKFSGWIKAEDYEITPDVQAGNCVHAFWFWVTPRGTDQRLQSASLALNKAGTFDWTYTENEFRVPCPVTLTAGAWKGFNGTVWYDDIRIERVGERQVTQTERGSDVDRLVAEFPDALRSEDGSFAVLFAPPVKKITRRIAKEEGALTAGPRAAVSLAKNESEDVQLVLAPLAGKSFTVEFYPTVLIHSATGQQIPGAVDVSPVGYVGYSDGKQLITEPWPDILLADRNVVLQPNQLQPLWTQVRIPADAPAGKYTTTVRITRDRKPVAIVPVDVRVYDFALPATPTLPTAFGSWTAQSQDQLLSHRVGLTGTVTAMSGYSRFGKKWYTEREFSEVKPHVDEALGRIEAVGGRHFNVEIPRIPGCFPGGANSIGAFQKFRPNYSDSQREYIVRYYRDYAKYLKDRGVFDNATVYLYDEPEEEIFDFITDARELIRKADPDLPCMVVGHIWPELVGAVDVWCPHVIDFDKEEAVKLMRERKAAGEKVWAYNTIDPPGYAGWIVDPQCDLLSTRLMFWIVRKYGFDGFLHWCSDRGMHPVVQLGNSTDCYLPKGPGAYEFGAGQLVYSRPIAKERTDPSNMVPDVMIPSIRLKAIRDGLEDHDYFVLLEQAVRNADENKVDPEVLAEAKKLVDIPPDIAVSFKQYTHDTAAVLNWRDRVASAIESLGTDAAGQDD